MTNDFLKKSKIKGTRSDAKVLITGESGVGKEVVARLIHRKSSRNHAPLVTINCAGLPDALLETELFGHVRGSFTDAYRDKSGLLETAHGGTILMDEVGEMSLRMQAVLLRFLENGEIQRLGAGHSQAGVDVRVMAATNSNLLDRIASKQFREDLYYRLNIIHLIIPPLRDRREDIPVLLEHFIRVYSEFHRVEPPQLSSDAMTQLRAYHWPGNVRELKNAVERVIVRVTTGVIAPSDFPAEITSQGQAASRPVEHGPSRAQLIFERMAEGGESFWSAVYEPFSTRDLTRDDLRSIVCRGLETTRGSYKILVRLFNMPTGDYKRFVNFLHKHNCHLPFQQFRSVPAKADSQPPGTAPRRRSMDRTRSA